MWLVCLCSVGFFLGNLDGEEQSHFLIGVKTFILMVKEKFHIERQWLKSSSLPLSLIVLCLEDGWFNCS